MPGHGKVTDCVFYKDDARFGRTQTLAQKGGAPGFDRFLGRTMNYLSLQEVLCNALRASGLFAHVEGHTLPSPTLEAFYSQSQPAALVRLQHVDWVPIVEEPQHYTGRARIELSLTANPEVLDMAGWQALVDQAKRISIGADESALLVEESTMPAPRWSYRIVFTYKIREELL